MQVMEGRLNRWAGAGHERPLTTRIWGSILRSRYWRAEKLKSERDMKCCAGEGSSRGGVRRCRCADLEVETEM